MTATRRRPPPKRPPGTKRRCQFCGKTFVDRSKTSPRSYCDDHSTRASRSGLPPAPKVRKIPGDALTMPHFRAWSRKLVLKGGKRFELEPWQARYVEDVFAALRGESGIRQLWLLVPEGNGKTTLIAALVLYVLEFIEEASIPIAASSRDQAKICYTQAEGFERRSPYLKRRFALRSGLREIRFGNDRSRIAKVFSADEDAGDGIIPYPLEVIDELHRHKTLGLFRTWAGKLEKEGAVMLVPSTAGEPGSEFEEARENIRQNAKEVERDGCFARYVGETAILHEYAVPEDGDVEDLGLVALANPSRRVTPATLAAKRADPSWNLAHWRRLTCNLPTRATAAAITELEWARAAAPAERGFIPEGATIDLGYDAAWTLDTTAIVPLWIPEFSYRLLGTPTVIEPPANGSQIEPDDVKAAINRFRASYRIRWLVADPSYARDILAWARDEGIDVIEKPQGNVAHALDYERFMEALRNGWLFHTGDATLKQHALNAIARTTESGRLRFDRPAESRTVSEEKRRRRVIDALTGAAMVHTVAVADLEEPTTEQEPMWAFG